MEKYNYLEAVTNDAKEAILENLEDWEFASRDELEDIANDKLWIDDGVTGNASGSYYCNAWRAEEALCHNWDLVEEMIDEVAIEVTDISKGPEWVDVAVRCWLLGAAIEWAIDELEEEGKIEYNNEDD